MNRDLQIQILRLLLEEGEDLSIREMARRLDISSSLTHYHLQKMASMGIVIHRKVGLREGYYEAQDLFTDDVDGTLTLLKKLCVKIADCSDEKLGNCIRVLLTCQKKV